MFSFARMLNLWFLSISSESGGGNNSSKTAEFVCIYSFASTSFPAVLLYVCQGCVRLYAHGRSQSNVCIGFITPNHPRVCELLSGRPCCVCVCFRPLYLITAQRRIWADRLRACKRRCVKHCWEPLENMSVSWMANLNYKHSNEVNRMSVLLSVTAVLHILTFKLQTLKVCNYFKKCQ